MVWFVVLVAILYYALRPKSERSASPTDNVDFSAYDNGWITFIKSYNKIAKTKAEKALIGRMLADLQQQGYRAEDPKAWTMEESSSVAAVASAATTVSTETENYVAADEVRQKTKAELQLDNASLLLYFGAFLLVASAGLFVAFGGSNGTLRTLVVLAVAVLLYAGGMSIFTKKPRFKQAGLAFVGIGMAITPLVGLAAYTYIFNKQNGAIVWLLTSVLCLAMYAHALFRLRNPLLNYVFIFTFVSLFEASIAVVDLPLYYFGWGLAAVGLLTTFVARARNIWEDMRESTTNSGMLFIPLSLLTSVALITQHGATQLGVSLLLAAVYYGIQAVDTEYDERYGNALASHIAALVAVAVLTYGITENWLTTGLILAAFNILQFIYLLQAEAHSVLNKNFASVVAVSSVGAVLLTAPSKMGLVLSLFLTLIMTLLLSIKQKRADMYSVSVLSLLSLPFVYAQYVATPVLSANQTVAISLVAVMSQLLVLTYGKKLFDFCMDGVAQYSYLLTVGIVIAASFFGTPWMVFAVSIIVSVSFLLLGLLHAGHDWESSAGLVACVPVLLWAHTEAIVLASVLTALIFNIFIAIKNRSEINRWISAGLWLLVPLAFGVHYEWPVAGYSWAYFAAMLGLIFSRAIARGVVFVSSNIPLAAYAKNSSKSYEYGYWFAAVLSVILSLSSSASSLHTTILLLLMSLTLVLVSFIIEKRHDILVLLPLLVQGTILSALRPVTNGEVHVYIVLATMLAVASYVTSIASSKITVKNALATGSLATAWIAPLSYIFVGETLAMMPIGLLVGTLMYAYHFRDGEQSTKEVVWSGVAVTIAWLFYYAGVRELQAYVHIAIALCASYAYWRHVLGQVAQSDQYLYAMLVTATVPLTLQAVGSPAGGLYGWWLLLEQVGFIILGMSIAKKFVTKWGLYTAVGAVLYQLRDLGWAALTVLALFLIGLAVYKIQKNND